MTRRLLYTFILLLALSPATGCLAMTTKHIWPKWEVNNPLSKETISHKPWQQFLNQNVFTNHEGINLVNYPQMKAADKRRLKEYINEMAAIDIGRYNRREQLAYWINLYNALTVHIIAKYYPVKTVRDIKISPG